MASTPNTIVSRFRVPSSNTGPTSTSSNHVSGMTRAQLSCATHIFVSTWAGCCSRGLSCTGSRPSREVETQRQHGNGSSSGGRGPSFSLMITLGRAAFGVCGETFVFFIELGVSFSSDLRFRCEDVAFDLGFAASSVSSSRLRRSSSTLIRTLLRIWVLEYQKQDDDS
jgi:hypothetical protein